jgi:hypothetical protein
VDVFAVDVFGGGGQQENHSYKAKILEETQVDIGLKKIKNGGYKYTKQYRIVKDEDDLF